jgi:hypothetical protein
MQTPVTAAGAALGTDVYNIYTSPHPVPLLRDILSGVVKTRRLIGTTCQTARSLLPAAVTALFGEETTDAVILGRLVAEKYTKNTCVFRAIAWMGTLLDPAIGLLLVEIDSDCGVLGRLIHASSTAGIETISVAEAARLVVDETITTITFMNTGRYEIELLEIEAHLFPSLSAKVRNRAVLALHHESAAPLVLAPPPPPPVDVRAIVEAAVAHATATSRRSPPPTQSLSGLKRALAALDGAVVEMEGRLVMIT